VRADTSEKNVERFGFEKLTPDQIERQLEPAESTS